MVKKVSESLALVKEAPVRSGDPAWGIRTGDVRFIKPAPVISAMVILSVLFLAVAVKYDWC